MTDKDDKPPKEGPLEKAIWASADNLNQVIKDSLGGGDMRAAGFALDHLTLLHAARTGDPKAFQRGLAKATLTATLAPFLGLASGVVASRMIDMFDPPQPPPEDLGHGARLPKRPPSGNLSGGAAVALPIKPDMAAARRRLGGERGSL